MSDQNANNGPICPHCSASPIRIGADVIGIPGVRKYVFPAVWCMECKKLLGIMLAPTGEEDPTPTEDETGLGPQRAQGVSLA